MIAYLDDLFIFSDNEGNHEKHLRAITICLYDVSLSIKLFKYEFFKI